MKMGENKFILDACCGGRMFWIDKNQPNTIFQDIRETEKGCIPQQKNFCVKPDIIGDFRKMVFLDKSFKLIVFDPPHLKLSETSLLRTKYGSLSEKWRDDFKKGFEECWRCLEDYGVLIFKWNDGKIKSKEILDLFSIKPLFGQVGTNKGKTKTIWFCYMKIPQNEEGGK